MTKIKTLIIAEAGCNHNGSLAIAKQLVDAAAEAKADFVKFQAFKAEKLASKFAEQAEYMKKNTKSAGNQLELLKKLELSEEEHIELIKYCKVKQINYLCAPFDLDSINMLFRLGMNIFKIPSGEITNLPYLRKIGSLKKNVIMSTGMANMKEIHKALEILVKSGTKKKHIIVLHCNTEYPTPMEDVNLKAMLTIREKLDVQVGYSDHTLGIEIPIAAVSLGATIIEKHFTLDRNLPGPDHVASLEPDQLKEMVISIRNIEKAIGDGVKSPSPSEIKNIPIARKSIVANVFIKKGENFSENNLEVKRPGLGISPMEWDNIIGQTASRDYKPDEMIE